MGIPSERYSKITDKNQREICLLKAFPCAWGKCAFCDYIEDNSRDEASMVELNHRVLDLITGEFGVLEVIDSASCFELPEQTLDRIAQVIKESEKFPFLKIRGIHYFSGTQKRSTEKIKKELLY